MRATPSEWKLTMATVTPFRRLLSVSVSSRSKLLNSPGKIRCIQHKHFQIEGISVGPIFYRSYCSKVLQNSDVTVDYRDGLPVVALPLPSRREVCEFTLKPHSHSVGDFIQFIKAEDGGIDTVSFFTKEGSRVAKSTTIDILMRSDFSVNLNDQKYEVSPPVLSPSSHESAQNLTDVKLLISQLYSSLHVESFQLNREKELLKRLDDLKQEIQPLETKAAFLAQKANSNTNRLSWLGLGMMGLQFGILARLTWWEYSWDIMEPVTYFVTYGTSIAMFSYFLLAKQEYIFPDVKDRQFLIKFHKLAKKDKLNIEKYNDLKEAIAEAEHDLHRLRDPLQVHLPIREIEKISKSQ